LISEIPRILHGIGDMPDVVNNVVQVRVVEDSHLVPIP